jgi:hypothetical protein
MLSNLTNVGDSFFQKILAFALPYFPNGEQGEGGQGLSLGSGAFHKQGPLFFDNKARPSPQMHHLNSNPFL